MSHTYWKVDIVEASHEETHCMEFIEGWRTWKTDTDGVIQSFLMKSIQEDIDIGGVEWRIKMLG